MIWEMVFVARDLGVFMILREFWKTQSRQRWRFFHFIFKGGDCTDIHLWYSALAHPLWNKNNRAD